MLTPKGNKNKKEIIVTIIKYIESLKKNIDSTQLKKIYNDYLKLISYKFKFFERSGSIDTVLSICSLVNNYNINPEHIFVIDIMQEYYSNIIKNNMKIILEELNFDNLVVISGSKKYEDKRFRRS